MDKFQLKMIFHSELLWTSQLDIACGVVTQKDGTRLVNKILMLIYEDNENYENYENHKNHENHENHENHDNHDNH